MEKSTADLIQRVQKLFKEKEAERQKFILEHGYINRPSIIKAFDDKTLSVLEGNIYIQTRDHSYNFVNIIHDHALIFFGDSFLDAEELKPLSMRHQALQWMYAWGTNRNEQLAAGIEEQDIRELGVAAAWFRFAYDLYTIRDNSKLEKLLKIRLLNQPTFQGARYELKIAALCIAAGFNLEFENDADNSRKHPEFIAIDKLSSAKIIIEAKSRHRRNVLGFEHGREEIPGESVGIKNLVLNAYKKQTILPLYVFIDVNLPPANSESQLQKWFNEIHQTMHELAEKGHTAPCPANVVFFTNDPSHYIVDRPLNDETDILWIKNYESELPRVVNPINQIAARLTRAFHQRVSSPENIESQ